eukprot:1544330-Prymnesium_polylepis.1
MHTIIRQPKHKFGPVLEVRQVGVFGRTRPELQAGLVSTPRIATSSRGLRAPPHRRVLRQHRR